MNLKFKHAIVRKPCPEMIHGITTASKGLPDYKMAVIQHETYVHALISLGLEVTSLEPDSRFPDSTFVEDVALCTNEAVVITFPGAKTRQGEQVENGILLAVDTLYDLPAFNRFRKIRVVTGEEYAANSLWVNGTILVPAGYAGTKENIERAGLKTLALDVSEFEKIDGGLSCLSLRF